MKLTIAVFAALVGVVVSLPAAPYPQTSGPRPAAPAPATQGCKVGNSDTRPIGSKLQLSCNNGTYFEATCAREAGEVPEWKFDVTICPEFRHPLSEKPKPATKPAAPETPTKQPQYPIHQTQGQNTAQKPQQQYVPQKPQQQYVPQKPQGHYSPQQQHYPAQQPQYPAQQPQYPTQNQGYLHQQQQQQQMQQFLMSMMMMQSLGEGEEGEEMDVSKLFQIMTMFPGMMQGTGGFPQMPKIPGLQIHPLTGMMMRMPGLCGSEDIREFFEKVMPYMGMNTMGGQNPFGSMFASGNINIGNLSDLLNGGFLNKGPFASLLINPYLLADPVGDIFKDSKIGEILGLNHIGEIFGGEGNPLAGLMNGGMGGMMGGMGNLGNNPYLMLQLMGQFGQG